MSDTYESWAQRHPLAAHELAAMLGAAPWAARDSGEEDGGEAAAQQAVRFGIAAQGGLAWRNNVGATPSKCPHCRAPLPVVRYGLANDSARLNGQIKSSDLVGVLPLVVTPDMVGQTVGLFLAVECKHPGWVWKGTERETAQAAWLALVRSKGGVGVFSTGEVCLV